MKEIRLRIDGPGPRDSVEMIISETQFGPEIRWAGSHLTSADRSICATFGPQPLPVTLILSVE